MAGVPQLARVRKRIEANVICSMAGPVAELRALDEGLISEESISTAPSSNLEHRERRLEYLVLHEAAKKLGEEDGASDDEAIRMVLGYLCGCQVEVGTYRAWLLARTHTLVGTEGLWKPCKALATALLETESMSGRAARRVMRHALEVTPLQERKHLTQTTCTEG
jgi:hypothetical protein